MAVNCPSLLTIPICDPHKHNSALEETERDEVKDHQGAPRDPVRRHLGLDLPGEHHLSATGSLTCSVHAQAASTPLDKLCKQTQKSSFNKAKAALAKVFGKPDN